MLQEGGSYYVMVVKDILQATTKHAKSLSLHIILKMDTTEVTIS